MTTWYFFLFILIGSIGCCNWINKIELFLHAPIKTNPSDISTQSPSSKNNRANWNSIMSNAPLFAAKEKLLFGGLFQQWTKTEHRFRSTYRYLTVVLLFGHNYLSAITIRVRLCLTFVRATGLTARSYQLWAFATKPHIFFWCRGVLLAILFTNQ